MPVGDRLCLLSFEKVVPSMTTQHSIAEVLGRTRLFGMLDAGTLAAIAAAMREVRFEAGQSIFNRGDAGSAIYVVIEGRVRLSVITADGRELSFTHALTGDVFGEIAVIDRSPRSADATALTMLRMMSLSAAATERLLAERPALARAFMVFLCARLREVSDHLEDVALLPIEARLARYLLNRIPSDTPSTASGTRIELGMSQGELALLLGASRPKVNAALMMLEDVGALERVGQKLNCDPRRLAEIARCE